MPTPSIQTLRADAQQVLNLDSISAVRSVVAATLANANAGTPLNPNLTTQQLWNEFYQIVTQPKSDIESIIANQLMKFLYAPPAPGGVGADKQVIFNDGGSLAGNAGLLFDKTTGKLTVDGNIPIWRGLNNTNTNIAVGFDALKSTIAGAGANTVVGFDAGESVTTGANNSFFGHQAGLGTTIGAGNVAVGSAALFANGTGTSNTAVGASSFPQSNSDGNSGLGAGSGSGVVGQYNIAVGVNSLYAAAGIHSGANNIAAGTNAMNCALAITGSNNVMVGPSAGSSSGSITGSDNIGIGRDTFRNLTAGSGNTAIGQNACNSIAASNFTTGIGINALKNNLSSDNVAIGASAMFSNTTGVQNTAVGRSTLENITTQNNCTALGYYAARANTAADVTAVGANAFAIGSGTGNTAIGSLAMSAGVVSGPFNTAIGYNALGNLTSGNSNTTVGVNAGSTTTTGSSNIIIGRDAVAAATDSNVIAIGSATYFVGTNGGANTFFATAGASLGYWRVSINGTFRKIQVFAD